MRPLTPSLGVNDSLTCLLLVMANDFGQETFTDLLGLD